MVASDKSTIAEGESVPLLLFVVTSDTVGIVLSYDSKASNVKVAVKGMSYASRVRWVEGESVS